MPEATTSSRHTLGVETINDRSKGRSETALTSDALTNRLDQIASALSSELPTERTSRPDRIS